MSETTEKHSKLTRLGRWLDPASKKLRKRFEIYPEALQATVQFARDLERAHTDLLKRIQAER